MTQLVYYNDQELPVVTFDWSGAGEDFSTGWTFSVRLARATAKATTLLLKTTGITSTATTVTVAWSLTDWDGLVAAVDGTPYVMYLYARRTADSKDLEFAPANPTRLLLKQASSTSVTPPDSTPVIITAATVTYTPAGSISATNVQAAITEVSGDLDAHLADTVDAHDASAISVLDTADRFAATELETGLGEVASLWKHKQSKAFMRNLALNDRPYSVAVMGDSTANGTDEWAYLTATWLGTKFPAYTVTHRLWDDTAQGWGALTTIQTGTAGEAYLATDGTNNRQFDTPDSATISPTGDISVRVKYQPTGSWTTGADSGLFNKFAAAGQRSWRFYLRGADAKLVLEHSSDGTALKTKTSTVGVPFASGEAGWIRADLDVDNGASGYDVLFYTSTDGSNWTQLGTTVTTATASSVFDSTATLNVGSRQGSEIVPAGKLYAADFYSGIGSNPTLLAAWRAGEMWMSDSTGVLSGYDMTGALWTGNSTARAVGVTGAPVIGWRNASVSGQALAYFSDATRLAKIHTGRVRLSMVNLSHNEGGTYIAGGDLYYTNMLSFVAQLVVLSPSTAVVLHGQNPKASPGTASAIALHRDRVRAVAEAAAVGDHGFVDAYTAMIGDTATYVGADGIHPTAAGSTLWAQLTERFLLNA